MDVVASAGHVDHGKSTLVRALTGMEPDRWAEERRRGMTIDLGFAWTTLETGRTVAFVDVPGHQRFVSNMLAGAGPAPAVLFVVAADEGWSRQSADHLAALDALGVRHGLIAVTKADRADPVAAGEWARAELARTTLGDCPVVAASAVTGQGLDVLRAALDTMLGQLPQPRIDGRVRLWIDRTFTIRGSGTVVTGTLTAGTLTAGDRLQVAGTGEIAHVRALQSLGAPVDSASAVARVAVNLRGVEPDTLTRGQSLLTPAAWLAVSDVDVRLTATLGQRVADAASLPGHLVAHIGSAAVSVRLRPLGAGHARLRLEHPLPLAVGDRFVLRDPGQQSILAGAVAVDVLVHPLDRRGAAKALGRTLAQLPEIPDLSAELDRRGQVRLSDLVSAGLATPDDAPPPTATAAAGWWISAVTWRRWITAVESAVAERATSSALHPGLPRSTAAAAADLPDERLLDAVVAAADSLVIDAQGVHGAATPTLPAPVAAAIAAVERQLSAAPFQAPEAAELAALGLDAPALAAAVREGALMCVAPGVYLMPDALDCATRLLAQAPQPFTMGEAKSALGTSRRVAVPLLELLDRHGRTRRTDDAHRIVVQERD